MPAKNRINSSICKAVRESESCSDFVVDFVTVRCTVHHESIMFERAASRAPSSLRLVSVRGVRGSEEERIAVRWVVGEILSHVLGLNRGFKSESLYA
jgi:hypothetical protein